MTFDLLIHIVWLWLFDRLWEMTFNQVLNSMAYTSLLIWLQETSSQTSGYVQEVRG